MSINEEELRMIASSPVDQHKFMVENLDGLNMLRRTLVTGICPGGLSIHSQPLRIRSDGCCNFY